MSPGRVSGGLCEAAGGFRELPGVSREALEASQPKTDDSGSVLELKIFFKIENNEKFGSKRRSAKDAFCIPFWTLFCIDLRTEFDAMLGRFCDALWICRT